MEKRGPGFRPVGAVGEEICAETARGRLFRSEYENGRRF